MSYLNTPRLTFFGQFIADPPTVNNDPTHFNNNTFQSSYQDYSTPDADNGWWNPNGTGAYRLAGCEIKSVTYIDGTVETDSAKDPIIGCSVADTDGRTAGKIVDLDAQQQMVSEIWGLIVRLVSPDGRTLLKGDYKAAPFTNIWFSRSPDLSDDSGAGAVYQSVLNDLKWDIAGFKSRYLNELFLSSPKKLSINFNVDRYNITNGIPPSVFGRLAGSIGPCNAGEPSHFVPGRQIFPATMPQNTTATAIVNFAAGVYDINSGSFVLDLGNAVQFNAAGVVPPAGNLRLAAVTNYSPTVNPSAYTYSIIGQIDCTGADWYNIGSGICAFRLNNDQYDVIKNNPLAVVSESGKDTYILLMVEPPVYVRADQFVFRLNPGDTCTADFYVTNLGVPQAGQTILIQDQTQALLPPNNSGPASNPPYPNTGTPPIPYFAGNNNSVYLNTTNAAGFAQLSFPASDPGTPRGYIDGQVYALAYSMQSPGGQSTFSACNQSNFLSVMIFSGNPGAAPAMTGWEVIQPIMQQYANLYPIMSKGIFNIADQAIVDQNAQILYDVFSRDIHDPNYMPATRDLSAYKQSLILNYLKTKIKAQESIQ